jgi:hypothetical protein
MQPEVKKANVNGVPVRFIHVNDADGPEFWLATVGCSTRKFMTELAAAAWILELVDRHRVSVTRPYAESCVPGGTLGADPPRVPGDRRVVCRFLFMGSPLS